MHLTAAGRRLFDETLPRFVALQEEMLRVLSDGEREMLSVLLARIVLGTFEAGTLDDLKPAAPADAPPVLRRRAS